MPFASSLYYQFHAGSADTLPVVLIHGAGGTNLYWPPLLRRLPGMNIYALDLPGHGKSDAQALDSISAYAAVLKDWLDAVGLRRVLLVGHSMGSAIAMQMALDWPAGVAGLGLVGASACLAVNPALIASAANPQNFQKTVDRVIAWSFSRQAPAQLTQLAAKRMAETRHDVLYQDFVVCNLFDIRHQVGQIKAPALLISGEEDKMTPLRDAHFLADNLPQARLEIIPGAGHMVMLEKPLEVMKALTELRDICESI